MVAGGDPRRGRGIGGYLRVQGTLPRRLVVVVVAGEYHVDDELCSGGRRLGWSRDSSERAAKDKSMLVLAYWVLEEAIDKIWAPGTASPEQIETEAEADRCSRSWGRRPPRGPPGGLAELW